MNIKCITNEIKIKDSNIYLGGEINERLGSLKDMYIILEKSIFTRKFIIQDKITISQDDIKLIDDKAKKIVSEFSNSISKIEKLNKENLEPIINHLIKSNETNFKGVGQPLRIMLTGSKFGPGIYDILISLGKNEVINRLNKN